MYDRRPRDAGFEDWLAGVREHSLVGTVDDCARASVEILRDPAEARNRALKGKELVRRRFLTPRLLRDWFVLFNMLAGNDTGTSSIVTA